MCGRQYAYTEPKCVACELEKQKNDNINKNDISNIMSRRLFFPSKNPHCLVRSVCFPFRIYSLVLFFFFASVSHSPADEYVCAEKSHFLHSDLK